MNFDGLAPIYPWMERLLAGNLMHRCRTAHLSHCQDRRRALLVGEGTGRFLVELLRSNPRVRITCVEQSAKMIKQMRKRLARQCLEEDRVSFENADFLQWPMPAEPFDLVATHFFLDCFDGEQLQDVIAKLAAVSGRDALWLLSDFQLPARGFQRWRAAIIIGALYRFFQLTTQLSANQLCCPDQWMEAAGYILQERASLSFGLTHSDLWQKANSGAETHGNSRHGG